MCFEQPGRLERLWGLHRPEISRVSGDPAVGHLGGRSRYWKSRDATDSLNHAGNQSINQRAARKRTDGVVDEHGVDLAGVDLGRERAKTGKFGSMSHVPAGDEHGQFSKTLAEGLAPG